MKIAIIPSWYNSPFAPARGSFIKAQADGLRARGHDVLLLVPDRDSDRRLLCVTEGVEDGVRCIRISVPAPWHRLLGFYLPAILASVFSEQISIFSPDVVHAHAVRPAGVLASRALEHKSIPYVLTEHSGPLKKFWWTPHGRHHITMAYQNASRLFAVSDFLRRDMVKHFGEVVQKTTVLPNGINTEFFASKDRPPGKGKLLFVGGLERGKGLHVLLNSLKTIPVSIRWHLTVVGIGEESVSLRSQALKQGLSDRIEWLGAVPYQDMPGIYESHDYVLVPSLHETFSMVCAEALACARPVIASRCGGPEEVVPSFGGKLVPPDDENALSEALLEAFGGSIVFEASETIDHVREKFSMDSLLDRLENVYANLIELGD